MEFHRLSDEAKDMLKTLSQGKTVHHPSRRVCDELFDAGYIDYHPNIVFAYGLTEKTRHLFESWQGKEERQS